MTFTPDEFERELNVVMFEDARAEDGWRGQSTNKSYSQLRAEIASEIGRLGGTMTRWLRGEFEIDGLKRAGVQIGYSLASPEGRVFDGRIDVAGLPHKMASGRADSSRTNRLRDEKSLRMALYNIRESLQATRILQDLSPGYAGLMPWILTDNDLTVSQLYSEGMGVNALPAPDPDDEEGTVTAEFREVEE